MFLSIRGELVEPRCQTLRQAQGERGIFFSEQTGKPALPGESALNPGQT